MRLASGIAPIKKMLNAHVPVGLGVDGSASNDCGNLLGEARQAMLLGRVIDAPDALTAREVLRMATRGGADVLDRDDIGIIQAGMSADIIAFRTDTLAMAGGAIHDPVASLVFCTPSNVDLSIINGKVVVKDGHLMTLSLTDIIKNHNQSVVALMN
jgi:cytosine/adenosine deaminase-related metal-dependent hydrolase